MIFFMLVTFVTYTRIPLEWQGSSLRANLNPSESRLSGHILEIQAQILKEKILLFLLIYSLSGFEAILKELCWD